LSIDFVLKAFKYEVSLGILKLLYFLFLFDLVVSVSLTDVVSIFSLVEHVST
jgi:hypothetical protein